MEVRIGRLLEIDGLTKSMNILAKKILGPWAYFQHQDLSFQALDLVGCGLIIAHPLAVPLTFEAFGTFQGAEDLLLIVCELLLQIILARPLAFDHVWDCWYVALVPSQLFGRR